MKKFISLCLLSAGLLHCMDDLKVVVVERAEDSSWAKLDATEIFPIPGDDAAQRHVITTLPDAAAQAQLIQLMNAASIPAEDGEEGALVYTHDNRALEKLIAASFIVQAQDKHRAELERISEENAQALEELRRQLQEATEGSSSALGSLKGRLEAAGKDSAAAILELQKRLEAAESAKAAAEAAREAAQHASQEAKKGLEKAKEDSLATAASLQAAALEKESMVKGFGEARESLEAAARENAAAVQELRSQLQIAETAKESVLEDLERARSASQRTVNTVGAPRWKIATILGLPTAAIAGWFAALHSAK